MTEPPEIGPGRGFRVSMTLADYAVVTPDGKLTAVGCAWNVLRIGDQPFPFHVAAQIDVPWSRTNEEHRWRLELVDRDGQLAVFGDEQETVVISDTLELGRPPGAPRGTMFPWPLVVAFQQGLPFAAEAGWFEFRLFINDETHEDWRLALQTVPANGFGQEKRAA